MTDPEVVALWELAESQDERLRTRFLDEATRYPMPARQLRARAEPALIAAVGLDSMLRDRAAKLLSDRFLNADLGTLAHRADVALIAWELEDQAGFATRDCAATVIEALGTSQPESGRSDWRYHLSHAIGRLEPNTLAQMLADYVVRYPADFPLFSLGDGKGRLLSELASLAERIDPAEADRIAQMFSATLVREKDIVAQHARVQGLISLIGRKAPTRAAKMLSDLFRRLLDDAWAPQNLENLMSSLGWLRFRMLPAEASRLYDVAGVSLAAALEREKHVTKRQILLKLLTNPMFFDPSSESNSSLVERMTPPEAAKVCSRVARLVLEDLSEEKVRDLYQSRLSNPPEYSRLPRWSLSSAVATLVERMSPGEAGKVGVQAARLLAEAIEKTTDSQIRRAIALDLTRVTNRMSQAEAAKVCGRVAQVLTTALEKETHDKARLSLAYGLACLAVRLSPVEAANAVRLVIHTAAHHAEDPHPSDLEDLYNLLNEQPTPSDASRAARLIMAGFDQEKDSNARWCMAAALALMASRMEPAEAIRICGPALPQLAAALLQKGDIQSILSKGLKVVSRSDSGQAVQASRVLAAALRETDTIRRSGLMEGLTAIADGTPVVEATEIAQVLSAALIRTPDDSFRRGLEEPLAKFASRMTPADVAKTSQVLADALVQEKDPEVRRSLVRSLTSLASRMTPADVAKTSQVLTDALVQEKDPNVRDRLVESLTSLASLMTPTEAAKVRGWVARLLADTLGLQGNVGDAQLTYIPMSILVPGTLVKMGMMPESERRSLASDLVSLAGSMEPAEANRICREVIRSLLKDLQAPDDSIVLLLTQLDPSTARALAREMALQVCSDNNLDSDGLNAILTDVGRSRPTPQPTNATERQEPLKKPLPGRLTTQELVELLKMPTCFGAARRVVLDHLGNIHGRRFVNHWEFVRFVREKGLDVDLTTPPRRPNREESIRRMLAILDGKP